MNINVETWLHVGAVLLPIPASIIAYFLHRVMTQLDRISEKQDVVLAEHIETKTQVTIMDGRVTRLEDWRERNA